MLTIPPSTTATNQCRPSGGRGRSAPCSEVTDRRALVSLNVDVSVWGRRVFVALSVCECAPWWVPSGTQYPCLCMLVYVPLTWIYVWIRGPVYSQFTRNNIRELTAKIWNVHPAWTLSFRLTFPRPWGPPREWFVRQTRQVQSPRRSSSLCIMHYAFRCLVYWDNHTT